MPFTFQRWLVATETRAFFFGFSYFQCWGIEYSPLQRFNTPKKLDRAQKYPSSKIYHNVNVSFSKVPSQRNCSSDLLRVQRLEGESGSDIFQLFSDLKWKFQLLTPVFMHKKSSPELSIKYLIWLFPYCQYKKVYSAINITRGKFRSDANQTESINK